MPRTRSFQWKPDAGRPASGRRSSGATLQLLDQRLLPGRVLWRVCRSWKQVAAGIREMVVRGAPAIGCVAAYGIVLAAQSSRNRSMGEQKKALQKASSGLLHARPTAVNLRWALERMENVWAEMTTSRTLYKALEQEAMAIENEDRQANQAMGRYGAHLLPAGATVMTICNTGSLATAGLGTAFGVIWTAFQEGKVKKVIALETRPYLQGARLTAYELQQERIPFELITDNMAGHLMQSESVQAILVGADRIAANGDTANKIGTYSLAVLASHHRIPFYVVAPTSTIDGRTPNGKAIPIEERPGHEVIHMQGRPVAPKGTPARHPAFDVTPASLITSIITEHGVIEPPYMDRLGSIAPSRERTALIEDVQYIHSSAAHPSPTGYTLHT